MAMLAKQGWRVFHQPELLVAQVFKVRYFPNSSFWEAKAPGSSSYCWQSIIKVTEVLVRGSRWVVGDGWTVRMWLDRWLPRPSTFKVISPPPQGRIQMKVEELIDTSTRVWCTDLLSEFFSSEEVSLILSLPISFRAPEDRLVWHYDERGLYSVKCGYWVAQQWLQSSISSASSSITVSAYERLWKHLWKAHIPPKVKNFTWRVCHDILPTKVNLHKKKVGVELACGVCQREEETATHVLFTCLFAKAVWFSSPFGLWLSGSIRIPLKDWLLSVLEVKEVDFELACMIMWGIWQERNSWVWRGSKALPIVVWQKVSAWLSAFQTANCEPTRAVVRPTPRWFPPSQGWVKINTDGAVKSHTNMGGVGVVLRDWMGGFLAVGEQQFPGITSVLLLEMFAVWYGLQVAQVPGFQQIVVESDSLNVIASLNGTCAYSSALGMIAEDVLQLASTFLRVSFIHASRLCNGVAHQLAKFALSNSNNLIWIKEPPTLIQDLLLQDICNSA